MTDKQTGNRKRYEERLNRVTAYLYDHLDDDIDLDKLAEIACLSPYHWHRIYRAARGETIVATVKRLRLQRAAGYLAQTSIAIAEIAKKSGYRNLQSFTRIFNSVYGMPPAQYRKQGSHAQFLPQTQSKTRVSYDVTIKTLPATTAITLEHVGPYIQIGLAFDRLYAWLVARERMQADMRSVAVFYDDPDAVPERKLRSRAGVIAASNIGIESPLEYTTISAGTYAVLRHQGPYADMKAAYQWLFGEWLPASGREAGDAPVFEEYLNSPRDTAPTELLSEIYLPLR